MNRIIIGIDPDVDKSGIAVIIDKKIIELSNLTFFQLFEYLKYDKENIEVVKIEASWLIEKSNWHSKQGVNIASRIGKNVGANHETGRKIVEMCQYLEIQFKEVKPLKKLWKGVNGKITISELNVQLRFKGIHEIINKTNQEMRDACLIALHG